MRADWRAQDLRGPGGPLPASVGVVVERTHLGLVVARAGEALLLGLSAAGLVLATIAWRRPGSSPLADPEALLVALVAALAAGLGWRLEHARSRRDVARALDARMRHHGALVTAWELEVRGGGAPLSPMAELVRARVLSRLRVREALRAMFPSLAIPVAAPIVGLGLLALALDRGRDADLPRSDLPALTRGLVETLELVEAGAGREDLEVGDGAAGAALDRAQRDRLSSALRSARDLSRRANLLAEDPRSALDEVAALDEELSDLAARLAERPELRRGLERARAWTGAARAGLAGAAAAGAPRAADGGEVAGGAAPVTPETADGTMGRSPSPDAQPDPAPPPGRTAPAAQDAVASGQAPPSTTPADPAREIGTTAGSWWPSAYDGIVAGWIQLERHADTQGR